MKNVMLNEISKASFLRKVKEATAQFKENWDGSLTEEEEEDTSCADTIEEIGDVIADSNIDRDLKKALKRSLAMVVEAAMGKKGCKKAAPDREWVMQHEFLTFVPFAAVVVTRNRNHHAYNIGGTYIMVHGAEGANSEMFGMDSKGCIISKSASAKDGLSHLPRLRRSLRPATNWEIEQFANAMYR